MAKCDHGRVRQTCSVCSPEQVFKTYRYRALKQRHLVFTLTLDQFRKIVLQACVFCGEQYEPRGIDRRDNNIGYNFANCQAACGPCNMLKKELGQQVFLQRVQKIANHQEQLRRRKQFLETGT